MKSRIQWEPSKFQQIVAHTAANQRTYRVSQWFAHTAANQSEPMIHCRQINLSTCAYKGLSPSHLHFYNSGTHPKLEELFWNLNTFHKSNISLTVINNSPIHNLPVVTRLHRKYAKVLLFITQVPISIC